MLINKSEKCITFLLFKIEIVTLSNNSKNKGRCYSSCSISVKCQESGNDIYKI